MVSPGRIAVPAFVAIFLLCFMVQSQPVRTSGWKRAYVRGMSCPSCGQRIAASLRHIRGVDSAAVNVRAGTIDIHGEWSSVADSTLAQAIGRAGFSTRKIEPKAMR